MIVVVDSTRVVLEDPDNDYINANFVQVCKEKYDIVCS